MKKTTTKTSLPGYTPPTSLGRMVAGRWVAYDCIDCKDKGVSGRTVDRHVCHCDAGRKHV